MNNFQEDASYFMFIICGSDGKVCLQVQETRIRSLGWENSLEHEMATYSSTFAWEIPWTEKSGSDAGRDWGQEEKGTTEDEMAGWHH